MTIEIMKKRKIRTDEGCPCWLPRQEEQKKHPGNGHYYKRSFNRKVTCTIILILLSLGIIFLHHDDTTKRNHHYNNGWILLTATAEPMTASSSTMKDKNNLLKMNVLDDNNKTTTTTTTTKTTKTTTNSGGMYPVTMDGNYDKTYNNENRNKINKNDDDDDDDDNDDDDVEEDEDEDDDVTTTTTIHDEQLILKPKYECPIWILDGWMLSRHPIHRHDDMNGYQDIAITWKQHSRRAFPLWSRKQYFLRTPTSNNNNDDELLIFAPGLFQTFSCHERHDNIHFNDDNINNKFYDTQNDSSNNNNVSVIWPPPYGQVTLNPILKATRSIGTGDALFIPCSGLDSSNIQSAHEDVEDFPSGIINHEVLYDLDGGCYNPYDVIIKNSLIHGYGLFANTLYIPNNTSLFIGPLIHMHRMELYDNITKQNEILMNYCFSTHSNSSSLLLLPVIPFVNAINHNSVTPNIRIELVSIKTSKKKNKGNNKTKLSNIESFNTKDLYYYQQTEIAKFKTRYITIRTIQPGDEIVMDYGINFEQALNIWKQQHNNNNNMNDFRYEIGIPTDFFPQTPPLDNNNETTKQAQQQINTIIEECPEWNITKLLPNQIEPATLNNGIKVGGMLDRIGLPNDFSQKMYNWALNMGLIDILHNVIIGSKTLDIDSEERLLVNGGVWWMKRFEQVWESDMHYLTTDDDISQKQFMKILYNNGYQDIINAIGIKYNHTSLTCYYPSLIAVSHCTQSFMHSDSDHYGNYNLIFPILQANVTSAELVLGNDNSELYVPYRYERDHAVVMGKDGLHGTAPCDYRSMKQMRVVISIYMADFTDQNMLNEIDADWGDPPYPRANIRKDIFSKHQHWHRNKPEHTLLTPKGNNVEDDDEETVEEVDEVEIL